VGGAGGLALDVLPDAAEEPLPELGCEATASVSVVLPAETDGRTPSGST
jgi:hypothetical protein